MSIVEFDDECLKSWKFLSLFYLLFGDAKSKAR